MAQSVFTQMTQTFITVLKVESTTWNRDSHELFDYESRHVFDRKFLLRKHARVFRNTQQVEIVSDGQQLPTNADYLLSVKARDGRFYVYPADRNVGGQNLQPRKLWLIIKHLPMEHYPLNEGDVIKLGRFKLRVKQIVTETNGANSPIDFKLDDVEVPTSDLTPEESQSMQCRICLLEGGVDDDPLVRACQCKGSIMYVHLDCLRHWVNGRLNLTEDPARSCCFIRQLQCELCKSPYPSTVTTRGVRLPIVKVPNVQPPFIVLENMVGPTNRGVHLCSMAVKKECKLGRGHESDVRIADVSISRFHAMIRYQDGCFYLQDHTSKFGTLVALRKPTVVERAEKLSVQVGRTVLHFTLEDVANGSIVNDVTELADSPRQQQQQSSQTLNQQPSGLPDARTQQPQPENAVASSSAGFPPAASSQAGNVALGHGGVFQAPDQQAAPSLLVGANMTNYSVFAPLTPMIGPVPPLANRNETGMPGGGGVTSPPPSAHASGTAAEAAARNNANLAFRANPISYSRPSMAADTFPINDNIAMGYASFVSRPYAMLPSGFPAHMLEHDGRYSAEAAAAAAGGAGHFRNPGVPDWSMLIAGGQPLPMANSDALTPLMMGTNDEDAASNAAVIGERVPGADGREADVPAAARSRPIIAPEIDLALLTRPVDIALYNQEGRQLPRVFSPPKRSIPRPRNSSTPPDQSELQQPSQRLPADKVAAPIGFPGSAQAVTDPRFVNALASKLQAMQSRFPQRPTSGRGKDTYKIDPLLENPVWERAHAKDELYDPAPQQRRQPTLIQPSSPYCPPECRAVSPFQGLDADALWRPPRDLEPRTPTSSSVVPASQRMANWQPVAPGETPAHARGPGRPEQASPRPAAAPSTPRSGSQADGNCPPPAAVGGQT
eukprot:Gregarina_sp_Pseudo_9__3298@NODE_347_length_3093_cov_7_685003_g327_i0_p1_GENE_NODE_347_length_3093_cov_7_685003_g327_i0NODE_347_length_3093_cov_7_685003_g327_i0_p1_ORF_typecomplete_len893_score149_29YopYscD_cpl/PF16697_5/7_1e02YopYscD_cpl/PF16697_5/34YopYscD_cpl/PF16697_5/4_4e10FHA/PF00498_26/7FHA/PF00498_26/7_7e10RINGv/PF12906_7/2_2e12Fer2_4/PF13510_6/0_19zfRING_2/PF13639_6/0_61_NODE_347_length_3093_cov_7_685003_g327_i03223000